MSSVGRSSIMYDTPVHIKGSGSVVGQLEGQGPLGQYFDEIGTDKNDMFILSS